MLAYTSLPQVDYPTMKKHTITFTCLLFALLVSLLPSVTAGPISGSNENYDYLMGGSDFSKFSIGVYSKKRALLVGAEPGFTEYEMTMKKTTAHIGYDILRWATVYALGGVADTRLDTGYYPAGYHQDYNGDEVELGAGVMFNLIDHDIADPSLIEDRIRVNASFEYTSCKSTWRYATATVDWTELFASLTVSIVNQIHGNRQYWPNSIGFFAGPIFSHIESSSLEHDGDSGFMAGMSIVYSENLTFDFGFERLESEGYVVGVNIRL
jgi:opacity protein-like surface antigen